MNESTAITFASHIFADFWLYLHVFQALIDFLYKTGSKLNAGSVRNFSTLKIIR